MGHHRRRHLRTDRSALSLRSAALRSLRATGGRVRGRSGPFQTERTLKAILEHSPSVGFAAPIHLKRLFAVDPDDAWTDMRLLAHAGAPCPPEVSAEARRRFGDEAVWEFYGSTEGQFTVCSPADRLAAPGSVGRARPNRRLRLDDDGHIWCTAPPAAAFTYWDDPERTKLAWRTTSMVTCTWTGGGTT
ncbi:MAG: acyl--CoA ligase [Candidatus Microthrix sp.]|nr:acyl--CoA ligase [Candidatus Microthrix sp.]